ncbi:TonB-dependent receptor, partial [Acidovorax sp. HMWF018]|uniref:TonB-dependent receptor plug domain-containing protein n=2 Tax=unclassified Acidovorax TaxID=2684926 RepID=UPI000D480D13
MTHTFSTHRFASRRAHPALHPVALATLLALSGTSVATQAQTAPAPAAAADAAPSLPAVTVSASGLQLGASDMTTPATVLEGDELVRRREATLGETLNSEPGITSSHFGAGASRPIIRGMDGPRVKVLSDGAELHDASTISPDHAVVSEPLLATQIEVLRGPSALVYGNGAVGGVVNVLDGKVPTAIPQKGYEGSAELRANSG